MAVSAHFSNREGMLVGFSLLEGRLFSGLTGWQEVLRGAPGLLVPVGAAATPAAPAAPAGTHTSRGAAAV